MKKTIVVSLLCLLAVSISALDVAENIPAGTKFVGRLDLAKMRGNKFYAKIREKNKAEMDMAFALFSLMSGMTFDEIDSAWVMGKGQDDGLILIEGDFDIERIKQLFSSSQNKDIVEKGEALFAAMLPDQRRPGQMNLGVIIDERTVAVGQPPRVEEFLAVKSGRGTALASQKVETLKKDFSDGSMLKISMLEMPEEAHENQILRNIVAGEMSLDMEESMDVKFRLFMLDDEIAKATEQILNGLSVYLRRTDIPQTQNSEAAKILKDEICLSLSAKSEESEVQITAKVKAEALERLIELQPKMNFLGGRKGAASKRRGGKAAAEGGNAGENSAQEARTEDKPEKAQE